jgi:transposase
MPVKYVVDLSADERTELLQLIGRGKPSARKVIRARILLKADERFSDAQIVAALDTSRPTVERTRKRFVEGGLARALNDKRHPGQRRKLTPKQEAHLIAVACTPAPDGHARWTLRLLADKVVELEYAESISPETVRQMLKKTNSNPGRKPNGVSRK